MNKFVYIWILLSILPVFNRAFGQIYNIDEFLEQCPTDDPAFSVLTNDFKIRRNDILVTNFPCTDPISSLSISNYTDEIIVLQGLRTIYYMDRGRTGHLPWTSLCLYDWMKSKIKGINIKDGSGSYGTSRIGFQGCQKAVEQAHNG